MRLQDTGGYVRAGLVALIVGAILLSWGHIVGFCVATLLSVLPLFVGGAIAYVINIPLSFFETHLLPDSNSSTVQSLRRPVGLLITFALVIGAIALMTSTLIPAVFVSIGAIRTKGIVALRDLSRIPALKPMFDAAARGLSGGMWEGIEKLDLSQFLSQHADSILGVLGSQAYVVVTSFTTVFFGLIFALALLLDLKRVSRQVTRVCSTFLGPARYGKLCDVLSVFDLSFHNYIVRQCSEAAILGVTAGIILAVAGFPYAIGVATLVGFAALVPIVGFPIAAFSGAFLVFTERPILALIFFGLLFLVQGLESNLVLPRIGDPKTVLTGAWPIVAVTIGGGIGGFLGMVVGNPIGSALYQLLHGAVSQHEVTTDVPETENEDS